MTLSESIAKHLREVFFGGNWTYINLKDTLNNVDLKIATKKMEGFNSIAALTFHIGYYITAVLKVLQGEKLNASDKYSFDVPPIRTEHEWRQFVTKIFEDAEAFANLVEQMPDEKILEDFPENKYGSYYRNLSGIIEHTHYHLGQIVILKKIVTQEVK
ncbi:MAG: DUF1572 domain-containing protein [Bacteroidetes bacterium]|nr:DUF1572 domain-containing protein [Bacteroidota bacterium]